MRHRVAAALVIAALLPGARASAQDAAALVDAASKAMGATSLSSITYAGAAAQGNFGQSRTISFGLASTSIRNYTRTIDFTRSIMRTTGETMPPAVPGGPPPQPGKLDETVTAAFPWSQQMAMWTSPWGFLRGAAANHATLKTKKIDGVEYKVLTWHTPTKAPSGLPYTVVGYLTADNLVDHVETWVDHPLLGDMHVETFYREYRDAAGVLVPTRIEEKRVGMQTFVARIDGAVPNPPALADLLPPEAPAPPAPRPLPPVASEKLADGVYRITGGYVSMAVELKDGIVVLEGPQSLARGEAVLAETRRLFPGKRIKYVVNTHPHFDHASGLAPFAAEGITILEDDNSRYFVEAALSEPRTLLGDALAKSHKKPKVEGVIDKMVLGDATRTIELYQVKNLQHSDAMLMAYLPKERILFTADFTIPPPGQPPSPSIATLIDNIERLHLDFDRFVTVHAPNPDRPLTRADLMALASKD